MEHGQLKLTVVRAKDLPSTELFVKEDPYVVIKYESVLKSEVKPRAGRNPVFNYTVNLFIQPLSSQKNIEISVMDRDMFFDDLMGIFVCPVTMLCDYKELWVGMIDSKGSHVGSLLLQMEFISSDYVPASVFTPARNTTRENPPVRGINSTAIGLTITEEPTIMLRSTVNRQAENIMESEDGSGFGETQTEGSTFQFNQTTALD